MKQSFFQKLVKLSRPECLVGVLIMVGPSARPCERAAPAHRARRAPPRFIRPREPALVALPTDCTRSNDRVLAWKQGDRVKVWRRYEHANGRARTSAIGSNAAVLPCSMTFHATERSREAITLHREAARLYRRERQGAPTQAQNDLRTRQSKPVRLQFSL